MTDRKATAAELATEVTRAKYREEEAHLDYLHAVEYRVRMGINLDLALEREASQ